MKPQRLDKTVASALTITRSEAVKLIRQGHVTVNDMISKKPEMHVDPDSDQISVNGKPITYEKYIYILMNKPAGVLSASTDNRDKTVIDLLPDDLKRRGLFPAGRLDKDTVGLLIITDDGEYAHNMLSPKKHVIKEYFACIDGCVTDEDVNTFKDGITLDDGYLCFSAELTILKSAAQSEILLKIREGKFHQVKRMFEACGKKVTYLKRTKVGGLALDEDLSEGQCRKLNVAEKDQVFLI